MDIYEAIRAENRMLEGESKSLVDATAGEPELRHDLLNRTRARFEAIESVRETYIYPIIRNSPGGPEIADEYQVRANTVRQTLEQLSRTPADAGKDFQYQAEIVLKEITDFLQWEVNEAHPALQKIIGDDTAAQMGEQIKAEEQNLFHQLLEQI